MSDQMLIMLIPFEMATIIQYLNYFKFKYSYLLIFYIQK